MFIGLVGFLSCDFLKRVGLCFATCFVMFCYVLLCVAMFLLCFAMFCYALLCFAMFLLCFTMFCYVFATFCYFLLRFAMCFLGLASKCMFSGCVKLLRRILTEHVFRITLTSC